MTTNVKQVIDWVKENGEVSAVDRLRAILLPKSLEEGIIFSNITDDTTCSDKYLNECKKIAGEITGKSCPL